MTAWANKVLEADAYMSDASATGGKIGGCVREALARYFVDLHGHDVVGLYDMVMSEVELPLLESVLKYTHGNQTRAAEVLGINRGTLRKKLKQYGLE